MRISDWSSDVCSSDLVNWPDGSFDLHFRGVGDAKQLGLRLHESAKADAFRRHPPGDRAGHYRAAAIARDVRSTGRNLSSSGFGRSGRGLCLRLLIVGAGGYLLLIEMALPRERALGQNRARVGRRPVRGDLGGISTLHYGQRLSRAYRIAQPFERSEEHTSEL